jgi:hypothetical protein
MITVVTFSRSGWTVADCNNVLYALEQKGERERSMLVHVTA